MDIKASENRLKGLLIRGEDDIECEDFVIKNYSLEEILSKNFGLDKYYYLTSFSNINKDILVEKYKIENIENKTLYECVFSVTDTKYWLLEVLNTFTNYEWEVGFYDYLFYDENKVRHRLTENKFNSFIKLFKKIYCVSRDSDTLESDLDLVNDEETRQRLERIMNFEKENESKKKKSNITLMGIISGLVGKGIGYTYFNIYDLKVYQLINLFYSVNHNEACSQIRSIQANGLWDKDKNVDTSDINWASNSLPM